MMEIRATHWMAALFFSVAIHTLIVQFIYTPTGTGTTGSQGVAVRLGTYTATTDAVEVPAETHSADPAQYPAAENNPAPPPASEAILSTPEARLVDVEPAAEAAASLTETGSKQIDVATSIVAPREVARSRPEGLEPVGADTADEVDPQALAAAEDTVTATAVANGGGESSIAGRSDASDSGLAGVAEDYYAELASWLGQHKRYPRRAKRNGQEGTVEVEFVIDQAGRLLRHRIVTSSGFELLDEEAYALIERAAPMPSIPEKMDSDALTIITPISFSLR